MKIDLKNRTGVIRLGSMHSMILGNKPDAITPEMIIEKFSKDNHEFEKFGIFDSSTPNYTTYYPDLKPEDLNPKDDEFIYPIFRALSATVVWKGYKPIDFSKDGVLKSAMNLLIGQTINADHETALGNALGSVKSVFWQESYTKDGINVPAGINAEFKIDGKSNPRIARGIQMDPPSIHSNSVSVRFSWEPSHKMNSDEDFYSKLGTRDSKGQLYRLIVTEVIQFSETSLVSHGADAFAQKIGADGMIVNPVYAGGVYNFSANDTKEGNKNFSHILDYKRVETLSFDNTAIPEEFNNNNNNKNSVKLTSMEFIEKLSKCLGLDTGYLTEENFETKVAEIVSSKETEISKLTKEKEDLEKEKETAETALTKAKEKGDKYDVILTSKRESVKADYKKLKGDESDEAILKMLDNQEMEGLEALGKNYTSDLVAKFPTKCKSCGSTELSKASSEKEEGEEDFGGSNGKVRSNSEALNTLISKKKKRTDKQ